jgi:polyhydroxybutyrate depolymerase
MRFVVAVLMMLFLAPLWAAPVTTLSVTTADGERSALAALPPPGSAPAPLVLLLHGRGGTAASILDDRRVLSRSPLAAWLPIAEREHIAVIALQGTKGAGALYGWNDCRAADRYKPTADDVGYVKAVVAPLIASHVVDPQRIFVMGMSNGAMMAFRLAVELDIPIAALASVSGSMAEASSSICKAPTRPMSLLMIHGTADMIVPIKGGEVRSIGAERGDIRSVDDTIAVFTALDGLAHETPRVFAIPHRTDTVDSTSITEELYGNDAHGLQVELLRVEGGGHAEPTIDYPYGAIYIGLAGAQNRDIESAEVAWKFFRDKSAKANVPAR